MFYIYIVAEPWIFLGEAKLNIIRFLKFKKANYNSTSLYSTFFHNAKIDFELNFLKLFFDLHSKNYS